MDYFIGANAVWTILMVCAIFAMAVVLVKGFKIMIKNYKA